MGKEEFKGKVTSSKGNKKKEVETTKEMLEEQKETNPKVILVDKMSLIGSKGFDGKGLETNLVLKGKVKDMGKGKKKKSFVSTQSSLDNSGDEEALALDGSCLDTLFSTSNGNEDWSIKEQKDEKLGKSRKDKGTKEKKTQDAFYTTLDISTKPKELNPRGSTMSLHPICLREGAIEYKIKTRGSPSPFASVKAIINPELLELDPNKLQEYLTTKLTLNFHKATPLTQFSINKDMLHSIKSEIASPPRVWKKKEQEESRTLGYGNEEASLLDGVCLDSLFSTTMENEIEQGMGEPIEVKECEFKGEKSKKEETTLPPIQAKCTTIKEPSPGEDPLSLHPLEVEGEANEFQGNTKEHSTPFASVKGVLKLALIAIKTTLRKKTSKNKRVTKSTKGKSLGSIPPLSIN